MGVLGGWAFSYEQGTPVMVSLLGFGGWRSGSGALGFGFGVQGSGFEIQGFGRRIQGLGFRVEGLGFLGLRFRVQDSGFGI